MTNDDIFDVEFLHNGKWYFHNQDYYRRALDWAAWLKSKGFEDARVMRRAKDAA